MMISFVVTGCTQAHKGWLRRKQSDVPPVAMQPVSLSGLAEPASTQETSEATGTVAGPATANNTDQVLAYIERLPGEPVRLKVIFRRDSASEPRLFAVNLVACHLI
jgi:hypothetical protein